MRGSRRPLNRCVGDPKFGSWMGALTCSRVLHGEAVWPLGPGTQEFRSAGLFRR